MLQNSLLLMLLSPTLNWALLLLLITRVDGHIGALPSQKLSKTISVPATTAQRYDFLIKTGDDLRMTDFAFSSTASSRRIAAAGRIPSASSNPHDLPD
jgi:hypothetical protein